MKLKIKYILPILLILTLIVPGCSTSRLPQSDADDSYPTDAVSENEDGLFVNMSRDAKEYLAAFCADNNIELNIKEDTYIGWYYDCWNVLRITFFAKNCYDVCNRLLIMRNVAYYIQDWINDNYSVEETPLYQITCWENYFSSSLPSNGYIEFANFNSVNHRDIEDAMPARSIEYVDLQVRYGESDYGALSFEGVTNLRTGTETERLTEDFSVLKHFPDLENVEIPILTPKTDEEIGEFIDDVKQYCPLDCDVKAVKDKR